MTDGETLELVRQLREARRHYDLLCFESQKQIREQGKRNDATREASLKAFEHREDLRNKLELGE